MCRGHPWSPSRKGLCLQDTHCLSCLVNVAPGEDMQCAQPCPAPAPMAACPLQGRGTAGCLSHSVVHHHCRHGCFTN